MNCGTLPELVNGQVYHIGRTTFKRKATYTCDTGYKLVGDSTRMCQATGVWSGSEPTCLHWFWAGQLQDVFSVLYILDGKIIQ